MDVEAGPKLCDACGSALVAESRPRHERRWSVGLVLLGCLLSLYLVGLALIGLGAWLWSRKDEVEVCPSCIGS